MKLGKLLFSIVVVSLIVSMAIPMAAAPKPDKPPGKPPKEEPPADPAIAFTTRNRLMVMNADGTNQAEVYRDGNLKLDLSWSPDGNAIAFLKGYSDSQQKDLWRIDISVVDGVPEGSNPYKLTEDVHYSPVWSPVGDEIAFIKLVDGKSKLIQTIPATGGTIETIYTAAEDHSLGDPAWNSDGSKLAFKDDYNGQSSIMVLDLSDSSTTTVYGPTSNKIDFIDWARTKDVLAFMYYDGVGNAVVTLDITEQTPTPEVIYNGDGRDPSWSPDDSKLVFEAYISSKGGYRAILVYEFSTEDLTELARGMRPDWCRDIQQ